MYVVCMYVCFGYMADVTVKITIFSERCQSPSPKKEEERPAFCTLVHTCELVSVNYIAVITLMCIALVSFKGIMEFTVEFFEIHNFHEIVMTCGWGIAQW